MSRQSPLGRDVVLIVVAGAALGIVYNGMGLAGRPPRGIPWVAVATALPTLEEMAAGDTAIVEPGEVVPTPEVATPLSPAPTTGDASNRGATGTVKPTPGKSTGSSSAPPAPGPTSTPPPAAETAPSPTPSVPDPQRTAPLPFIPDSDQPIQVQMATVRRFFDAKAALFLDARDPADFEKGHIPGAIRVTNMEAQNEPARLKGLPLAGKPTIVYCEGGTCEASLELARHLIESGWKKVLVYTGGFPEWEAAANPVNKGSAP